MQAITDSEANVMMAGLTNRFYTLEKDGTTPGIIGIATPDRAVFACRTGGMNWGYCG